jgi:hypothetical protein|nr:MAG TPA: hypothetical protein [Caudoviricetes sp.]
MAKKTTKKAEVSAEEKLAKKKARMEALKNRPAGQRCNSKQFDVIVTETGKIETYGYVVKVKGRSVGVYTTTVAYNKAGEVVSVSNSFIPGELTIKAKKGHGVITGQKPGKGSKGDEEEEEED